MTTVVNNTSPAVENKTGSFYLEAILLIGFAFLVLYFGIPVILRLKPIQINMKTPQIVLPDKINVNVNQAK